MLGTSLDFAESCRAGGFCGAGGALAPRGTCPMFGWPYAFEVVLGRRGNDYTHCSYQQIMVMDPERENSAE